MTCRLEDDARHPRATLGSGQRVAKGVIVVEADEPASAPTCVMGDAASAEDFLHRAPRQPRFRSAGVRMVPIRFAALCELALAEWVVDSNVDWRSMLGLAAGACQPRPPGKMLTLATA